MQPGLEQQPDYSYLPDQNLIGLILFVMYKKSYQMIFQILWVNL